MKKPNSKQSTLVKIATRWPDDKVSAFDENGREIAGLCGPYEKMKDAILSRATRNAVFRRVVVSTRFVDVTREEW